MATKSKPKTIDDFQFTVEPIRTKKNKTGYRDLSIGNDSKKTMPTIWIKSKDLGGMRRFDDDCSDIKSKSKTKPKFTYLYSDPTGLIHRVNEKTHTTTLCKKHVEKTWNRHILGGILCPDCFPMSKEFVKQILKTPKTKNSVRVALLTKISEIDALTFGLSKFDMDKADKKTQNMLKELSRGTYARHVDYCEECGEEICQECGECHECLGIEYCDERYEEEYEDEGDEE